MDEIEKAYLEWMNGIADTAIPERAEEIKLEGRLYDAFLSLPTLKAKQNAVVTIECWAKQYAPQEESQ